MRCRSRSARGATFVARAVDRDKKGLVEVLRAAAQHRGAAFVEVLQDCPVFNDGAFDHLTDRDQADANRIRSSTASRSASGSIISSAWSATRTARSPSRPWPRSAPAGSWCTTPPARTRRLPSRSRASAFSAPAPCRSGSSRAVDAPPWGEGLVAQLRDAREQVADDDLDALLRAGDTWTIRG